MRRIHVLAVVLTLAAMPSFAGLTFRYTRKITGNPFATAASGTVWLSDGKYRHVLDPDPSNPRAWDIAIFNGADTILLNTGNQTWYREKRPEPPREAKFKGTPKVTHQVEGEETLDGKQTTKHVIRAEYKMTEKFGDMVVGSKGSVLVMVWVTREFPPVPLRRFVETEFAAIDEPIYGILDTIEGMPVRLQVVATRAYDGGGRPSTIMSTTTFTDVEKAEVPASRFQIPRNYREQEPVVSAPDVIRR